MTLRIQMPVADQGNKGKPVTVKIFCLFQPLLEQDLYNTSEFKWSPQPEKGPLDDEAIKIKVPTAHNGGMVSVRGIFPKKRIHTENILLPAVPDPSPCHVDNNLNSRFLPEFNQSSKSISADVSPTMRRKVSLDTSNMMDDTHRSRPSINMPHLPSHNFDKNFNETVNRKLKWFVDSRAVINKKDFMTIFKTLKGLGPMGDGNLNILSSLNHLTSYFESMLKKLVVDHKSKFLEMEFIKGIFADEIEIRAREKGLKRQQGGGSQASLHDHLVKQSPVDCGYGRGRR